MGHRVLPPALQPHRAFLRTAERYFGLSGVRYLVDLNTPDVAALLGQNTVLVGPRWFRAGEPEQQKRLTHELLHLAALPEHVPAIGYDTDPYRDRFSWRVYRHILAGARRWDPARFGVERYAH